VRIYDSAGRLVRQLLNGELRGAGAQQIQWNGIDDDGNPVAPDVYLSVIVIGRERSMGKMTLTR